MKTSEEVKNKIIKQEYKGTLYPDFEQVISSIETLEDLKGVMESGLQELTNLPEAQETEITETIKKIDETIITLAESLFVEDNNGRNQ